MGDDLYLIWALVGIIAVLVFTYFGSRWLVKRYNNISSGKKLKLVDRMIIGKDKSILVADIYGERYILGVASNQITLLKELGEVKEEVESPLESQDFVSIFSGMLKKRLGGGSEK